MKNIKWYSHTIVWQILQQLKVYFSYKQAIFTRGYLSQKNENLWLHKSCTWMLTAAFFIIANKWKQNKCPSVGEKLNCSTSLWWMKRLKDSSKFIYRFNAILIKVPAGFFFLVGIEKLILKFIWICKWLKTVKAIFKKKNL